ncbi:hypothetical protein AB0K60_03270 [Thermopolyspora sp. NPDC052614]|uniref:hypothetical protein n=1 Tax=Thermopolyspora sp. NPDC052614 TaxID=3155682 RepID=UPI00342D37AB
MFLVEYPAAAEVKGILAELERAGVPRRTGTEIGVENRTETGLAVGPGGRADGGWCVWVTVPTPVLPIPAAHVKRAIVRAVVGAIARSVADSRPPWVEQGEVALTVEMPGPRLAFLYGADEVDDQYAWDAMFMLAGDCETGSTFAWDAGRRRWFTL